MNYIQNKLDEFDTYFHRDNNGNYRLLFPDMMGKVPSMDDFIHLTKRFMIESLTDYHNHIVEKVKNEPNPFMGENDKKDHHTGWEYAKKDILSLLQDTNPKE